MSFDLWDTHLTGRVNKDIFHTKHINVFIGEVLEDVVCHIPQCSLCEGKHSLPGVSTRKDCISAEELVCFYLVDVLILAAGWHRALLEAQPEGRCAEPRGWPFLCHCVASLIFPSLVLMSPNSVLMLVVWCANIVMMSQLKSCETMSNATCRSRVLSYSSDNNSEVSLMVCRVMLSVRKQHYLIMNWIPWVCYNMVKHTSEKLLRSY